jgi:hypothetical protein
VEVDTPKGKLRLRKPNVLEIYDYLEAVGSLREDDPIRLQGLMIKAIRPYIDESGMEEKIGFDAMIENPDDYFKPLVKLSDELYYSVIGVLSKKA